MTRYFAVVFILALVALVHCETNAERFRRGLPPLPPLAPVSKRGVNSARSNGGLSGRVRRDNYPSCAPISSTHGIIQLQTTSGAVLGYIGNYDDSIGVNELATLPGDALEVDLPSSLSAPFYIEVSSPPEPGLSYLALSTGATDSNLAQGSAGYAYLTASSYVAPNTPPTGASYSEDLPAETTLWTMSCTLQLSGTWTNTDKTQISGVFWYDVRDDIMGMTGDFSTFNANYPVDGMTEVNFYFVPQ